MSGRRVFPAPRSAASLMTILNKGLTAEELADEDMDAQLQLDDGGGTGTTPRSNDPSLTMGLKAKMARAKLKAKDNSTYFTQLDDLEIARIKWSDRLFVLTLLCIANAIAALELEAYYDGISVDIAKASLSFFTLCSLYGLVMYYSYENAILRFRGVIADGTPILLSPLWTPFVLEFLVILVHAPPFVNYGFDSSLMRPNCALENVEAEKELLVTTNMLNVFVFLRLYQVVRVFAHHSRMYSPSGRFVSHLAQTDFSTMFVIKSIVRRYHIVSMLSLFVSTALIMAYVFNVLERRHCYMYDYRDSLWFLLISMFTVGYGDIVPQSTSGRIAALLGVLVGVLLTSILVAVLADRLKMSTREEKVFHLLDRSHYRGMLRGVAMKVLQSAVRFHLVRRNRIEGNLTRAKRRMFTSIQHFRDVKAAIRDAVEAAGDTNNANILLDLAHSAQDADADRSRMQVAIDSLVLNQQHMMDTQTQLLAINKTLVDLTTRMLKHHKLPVRDILDQSEVAIGSAAAAISQLERTGGMPSASMHPIATLNRPTALASSMTKATGAAANVQEKGKVLSRTEIAMKRLHADGSSRDLFAGGKQQTQQAAGASKGGIGGGGGGTAGAAAAAGGAGGGKQRKRRVGGGSAGQGQASSSPSEPNKALLGGKSSRRDGKTDRSQPYSFSNVDVQLGSFSSSEESSSDDIMHHIGGRRG